MSLEKIVAEAMAGRPLEMKEAFEEEIQTRIQAALEEKAEAMLAGDEELEEEELEEAADEDDEDEDDEDDEDDDDEDEDEDDRKMASEMKKLHASACSKVEMYAKMKEKYGCSKGKFEGLYASNCGG